jgi:hypothetical protein
MAESYDDILTLEPEDELGAVDDFEIGNKTVPRVQQPIYNVLGLQKPARNNDYLDELDKILAETLNYAPNSEVETIVRKKPEEWGVGIIRVPIAKPIRPSATGMFKQLNGIGIAHTPIFQEEPCKDSEEMLLGSLQCISAFSKPEKKIMKQGGWVGGAFSNPQKKAPSQTSLMDRPTTAASQFRPNYQPTLHDVKPPTRRSIFQTAATNSLESVKEGWNPTV